MNKIINIKTNKAIKEIRAFKEKEYASCDVKFTNVHLKELNKILKIALCTKYSLLHNLEKIRWKQSQYLTTKGNMYYPFLRIIG